MEKTHYTCLELAELALPGYPTSRQGWDAIVRKDQWEYVEVRGKGRGGKTRTYLAPADILKAIRSLGGESQESDNLKEKVSEPGQLREPLKVAEPGNVSYGRRADDFKHPHLEEFVQVPRGDIHARVGNGASIHSDQILDHWAFKADWVRYNLGVAPRDLALISVKGDSMVPTLSSGDMVLIDTHLGRVEDDAMYVFRHTDGDLLVKRIQKKPDGTLILTSDNKEKYSDCVLNPPEAVGLHIVGRVVWRGCRT